MGEMKCRLCHKHVTLDHTSVHRKCLDGLKAQLASAREALGKATQLQKALDKSVGIGFQQCRKELREALAALEGRE